jgi:hypothetical protein
MLSTSLMTQVSLPDAPKPDRREPPPPLQRVDSVEALETLLGRHLVRSRRQGDLVALLWIAIELAHPTPAGRPSREEMARALGARLQHRVRRTDSVIEVSAMGFAVLLDADRAGAKVVKHRLLKELRGPYGMDGGLANIQLDIGLAASFEAYGQGRSLLQCAMEDLAAQRAPSPDATPLVTEAGA